MPNDRTMRRLARLEQKQKGPDGKHIFSSLSDVYSHLLLISSHRQRVTAGDCALGEGLSAPTLQLMQEHDLFYGRGVTPAH